MKKHQLIIFTLLLFFSLSVYPQESFEEATGKINYRESSVVPPFCGSSKTDPKYRNIDWGKKFGPDFVYINHYCDAKAKIPVCFKYPDKEKKACLADRLEGTTYFFRSMHGNSPLLPFLYTEHGVILKEIGRYAEAIDAFNTAIKKNNSYIKAYGMLADTYTLTKQYNEAEAIINEGLKLRQSPALFKRLEKIKAIKKLN